jgi:ABC-type thiamin/hydroxymethylpyrimidine transport system permease subunit
MVIAGGVFILGAILAALFVDRADAAMPATLACPSPSS